MKDASKHQVLNRTFARRIGKSLSNIQKNLLEHKLPNFLFAEEIFASKAPGSKVILEIGIGMGEHFTNQAKLNPADLFLGAEVYLNGVANALKISDEEEIDNFRLWPNDVDLLLDKIPAHSLDAIYILFPDPWPKRKQRKKRMVNNIRLNIFKEKLKDSGLFIFATDIDDYFTEVLELINLDKNFHMMSDNFLNPHEGYIKTKYNEKATLEGREAKFLQAKKI